MLKSNFVFKIVYRYQLLIFFNVVTLSLCLSRLTYRMKNLKKHNYTPLIHFTVMIHNYEVFRFLFEIDKIEVHYKPLFDFLDGGLSNQRGSYGLCNVLLRHKQRWQRRLTVSTRIGNVFTVSLCCFI